MSTRANIIIKDNHEHLFFYRHCDGYPEGARPTLEQFVKLLRAGKLRKDVGQSAGHLIILGFMEENARYKKGAADANDKRHSDYCKKMYTNLDVPMEAYNPGDWKVGNIEPTTCIHDDIEWLYVIDLMAETITQAPVGSELFGRLTKEHQ